MVQFHFGIGSLLRSCLRRGDYEFSFVARRLSGQYPVHRFHVGRFRQNLAAVKIKPSAVDKPYRVVYRCFLGSRFSALTENFHFDIENRLVFVDLILRHRIYQPAFRKKKLTVVGIAIGKDEAFNLVQEIVQDVHDRTGGFGIKEFFVEDKE